MARRVNLWKRVAKVVGGILIVGLTMTVWLLVSVVDVTYVNSYFFQFRVFNQEGKILTSAHVEVRCWDKRGEYGGEYGIKRKNGDYIAEYRYEGMTSYVGSFFPRGEPTLFMFSVQAEGYKTVSSSFLAEKLNSDYLQKMNRVSNLNQEFFFQIPDFILERAQ